MPIFLKTQPQIDLMRKAGQIVAQTLDMLSERVKPGVTTAELDRLAYDFIRSQGAVPSFKGYKPWKDVMAFPGSICASVNEEIVHGIPGPRRLEEGDIIAIDCGAIYRGWHGDSACTVAVGEVSEEKKRLLAATQEALNVGVGMARPGVRIGDLSSAIEDYIRAQGYGTPREYGGHGIGKSLWEEPSVPNIGQPKKGVTLKPGMVIAIEPMLNMGTDETAVMPDRWTVSTLDGQPSAHFEHTVAITENGPDILTLA
jgi:methionyl aminopeptidase